MTPGPAFSMAEVLRALKASVKQIRVPLLRGWIDAYFAWRYHTAEVRKYRRWIAAGKVGPPPPLRKQEIVRSTGHQFGVTTLIETGTFEGKMVEAVERDFDRIFTIELDPSLGAEAAKRFRDRPHITVLQGDSGQLLPRVLAELAEPAVFWLDAHYSGGQTARGPTDTPIMHELSAIVEHRLHREHVLLIDDAREFSGGTYPTLESMGNWAQKHGYETMIVEDDIIRIFNAGSRRGRRPGASRPA
jgi:hypothetical protein